MSRAGFELKIEHTVLLEPVPNALAEMLQPQNSPIQSSLRLREWPFEEYGLEGYKIVIQADKRPAAKNVRRYNGPSTSDVAAIVPGSRDGEARGRNLILRRCAALLNTGNKDLIKIPISQDPMIRRHSLFFSRAVRMTGIFCCHFAPVERMAEEENLHQCCTVLKNVSSNLISSILYFTAVVYFNNTS